MPVMDANLRTTFLGRCLVRIASIITKVITREKENDMGDILKPCPFCGGEAKLERIQHDKRDNMFIQCKNCGCATRIFSCDINLIPRRVKLDDKRISPVVEAWNRRADE